MTHPGGENKENGVGESGRGFFRPPDPRPAATRKTLTVGGLSSCSVSTRGSRVLYVCLWNTSTMDYGDMNGDEILGELAVARASKERHQRLFETMAQGIVYQDAEG